ncbi:hypothetical protein [Vibrio parahaemolyticus]|uniref:hypothetical protein n=1 Tax=Vibrio parahaemolyticus TaxID=670 RepID=UPI00100FE1B7|nr:hypothetical protein [Vibrio parahaemolyticus]RXP57014.1 hypothetical protein EGL73_15410 [Vibrio parahaemolyticus]
MKPIQTLQRSASTIITDSHSRHSQTINVNKVRNVQPNLEFYAMTSRTLDALGIDDNRNKLSHLNQEQYNVFVRKDKSGKPDLNHGAYVSKKGEDEYADFRWLNPRGLKKYQTKEVAVVTFSDKSELTQLNRTYAETPLPDFLIKILNQEECRDTALYNRASFLAEFIPPVSKSQHGYLIGPNSPYCSDTVLDKYINHPETLKERKEGITLCTYAIHPSIQSTFLGNQYNQSNPERIEVNSTTSQKVIDEKTKIDSLTSILSLKKEHLPQLKKLKEATLQHLNKVYHTDGNDNIRMFFHFPVAKKTATLHLHTWVNKGDHPLNEPRSFELDTIIEHLEKNKSIHDLVINRNGGSYFLPTSDSIKDIPGIPFKGVKNNKLNFSF